VARQRQRARDRKAGRSGDGGEPRPAHPGELHRADVPGALDHATGDIDEFEAAIVSGAGGVPVDDSDAADAFGREDDEDGLGLDDEVSLVPDHRTAGAPTRGGGNRVLNFLRASWAELQRVQWPDRRQTFQATGVVAGFVVIAGLYLGFADYVAQRVVNFILNHAL